MATKNRILLIDDEPHFLQGHIFALEDDGYVVTVAKNLTDAMANLQRIPYPDLIILDIILPYSEKAVGPENGTNTGILLLEKLRDVLGITVPIILLTVVASRETHERIIDTEKKFGSQAIIRMKPFLPSELLEEVRKRLMNSDTANE